MNIEQNTQVIETKLKHSAFTTATLNLELTRKYTSINGNVKDIKTNIIMQCKYCEILNAGTSLIQMHCMDLNPKHNQRTHQINTEIEFGAHRKIHIVYIKCKYCKQLNAKCTLKLNRGKLCKLGIIASNCRQYSE